MTTRVSVQKRVRVGSPEERVSRLWADPVVAEISKLRDSSKVEMV